MHYCARQLVRDVGQTEWKSAVRSLQPNPCTQARKQLMKRSWGHLLKACSVTKDDKRKQAGTLTSGRNPLAEIESVDGLVRVWSVHMHVPWTPSLFSARLS